MRGSLFNNSSESAMKSISLLFSVLLFLQFTSLTRAQNIPNGDFEDWIIGGGPDLWTTNNLYYPPIECILVHPDFQAYSGNICAMGIVDSCIELSVLYPPILTSFDISLNVKPEALHGFYKYFPNGEDLFSVRVELFADSILVGEGSLKSKESVIQFTEFVVNFDYTTSDIPDLGIIEFTIDSSLTDNQLHQGSKWFIDFLSFGPLSAVDNEQVVIPTNIYLYQNFPNPFNPVTTIKYHIPDLPAGRQGLSFVSLKVYDVLGNEIAILVSEKKTAGIYEVEFSAIGGSASGGDTYNLSSGIYFYQLQVYAPGRAGIFIKTRKMILLR